MVRSSSFRKSPCFSQLKLASVSGEGRRGVRLEPYGDSPGSLGSVASALEAGDCTGSLLLLLAVSAKFSFLQKKSLDPKQSGPSWERVKLMLAGGGLFLSLLISKGAVSASLQLPRYPLGHLPTCQETRSY